MPADGDARHDESDFHLGAQAFSSDGVHVGSLHRVVVDGDTRALRELIVQESRRFAGNLFAPGTALITNDVVVPIRAIRSVSHERVEIGLTAAEIRRLPPYLSYTYTPLTAGDALRMTASLAGGIPFFPGLVESLRKSATELEINLGENIMLGHTGHKLGHVRDVLFDGRELVGVVMHPTRFFSEDVVLQVRFLDRSDDAALFAHLTDDDLAHLQPFHPEPEGAR